MADDLPVVAHPKIKFPVAVLVKDGRDGLHALAHLAGGLLELDVLGFASKVHGAPPIAGEFGLKIDRL